MRSDNNLPVYPCPRLPAPVRVDGDIGKPAWQKVSPHWLRPADGETPPGPLPSPARPLAPSPAPFQPTAFRAAWTATHLYLAFQCADRDIWGTCTRRDAPLYDEEVVEAFLCPTGDLRHYYELEVSPRNMLFDGRIHSPDLDRRTMTVDTSWDCPGIESAVVIHGALHITPPDAGRLARDAPAQWWSVEIALPFAAFPEAGAPGIGDRWRANFYRIDRAVPPEFTAWSPTLCTPPDFHVPRRFGYLLFAE